MAKLCKVFHFRSLREKCPDAELFLVLIQSEYRKIRTRNNSVFETLHAARGLRGSWLRFWISWENINHYLKRSFPLMISSVNVTKSPDIYWRNPSWKTSFFVQFNYSLMQALIKIIAPTQLEEVFRGINKCNKSF